MVRHGCARQSSSEHDRHARFIPGYAGRLGRRSRGHRSGLWPGRAGAEIARRRSQETRSTRSGEMTLLVAAIEDKIKVGGMAHAVAMTVALCATALGTQR